MSDQLKRDGELPPETLKQSLRNSVEKMDMPELAALIEFAEQTRAYKQEAAREELLAEFEKRALQLGLSFEGLVGTKPGKQATRQPAIGKKVSTKYRGPNGEEWSGRGRKPKWLSGLEAEGGKRADFAVSL